MQKKVVDLGIHKPSAPYSYAIRCGDLIFTAGIMSTDLVSGEPLPGDMEFQTKKVLENMKMILEKCGTSLNNVIKTTVFLRSFDDYSTMNRVYERYFPEEHPARSTIEVSRLALGSSVEIEAIAVISQSGNQTIARALHRPHDKLEVC